MGEKANGGSGAAARAWAADRPAAVRNVALVGHHGAGKTTLVEALALAAGAVPRAGSVEDGTTVADHDELEHRRRRSVQLSVVPVRHGDLKINLIDTPGYPDFVGELRAGLRAADAALFVVSAADDGVSGAVRMLWDECAAVGMPRAIVLTRLDSSPAGFDELVAECGRAFGGDDPDAVLPLYLPVRGEPSGEGGHRPLEGLVSLLTGQGPEVDGHRNRLIEGVIGGSEDESLMERYLAGEPVDPKTLVADLERAVARGVFFPILAAAPAAEGARCGVGTPELLELIAEGFPPPGEHAVPAVVTPEGGEVPALACDPDGPLAAEVVRTATDPYVGRISLVRVFSGTLTPDLTVHVCGHGMAGRGHQDHDADERVGALAMPFGKEQLPVDHCVAGDICTVAKLAGAETGDTVSSKERPLLMAPWPMPEPLLPVAVEAHGKADEEKLAQGLARLVAEDPTLRMEQNPETHQLVLWCIGEAHAEALLDRLVGRYGVRVDVVPHEVPLRATFAAAARGRGRHVKQSGGHGQFAICEIEVEPLPGGSGVEFVDRVVGGAVPRQFVPSVEKGVRAQCAHGIGGSGPVVDVRVTLVDGKAHSVDSSDAAFQTAGGLALRAAAEEAGLAVLEPVAAVSVVVPDDCVGAVLADLAARRGRVLGTEPVGAGGRTVIRADVPEAGLGRYAVDLRSLSHGTGAFTRVYARHAPRSG